MRNLKELANVIDLELTEQRKGGGITKNKAKKGEKRRNQDQFGCKNRELRTRIGCEEGAGILIDEVNKLECKGGYIKEK